ncbi:hypothetical protein D6C97_09497 [Aureobasidium pullulans]|nr:hypothetical protein D6C97_09497 [Aureobasidium pullulans]
MNSIAGIQSLESRIKNAYKARWARSGQDTPEVLFDKEFRPDTRNISVHILWTPSRIFFHSSTKVHKTRHEALSCECGSNFAIFQSSRSLPATFRWPPTQVSKINSTGHPAVSKKQNASTDKTAPISQIAVAGSYQGIKPKADTLFKNLPAWVIGDKTADTKSAGSSDNPGFAFGSGPILSSSGAYSVFSKPLNPAPKFGDGIVPFAFNGSFGKKAVLDEARERQKRKEEDMDSDEDEEDWEKRDAARQARKKAKLLTVIQPSKQTFGKPLQPLQSARATFSLGSGHTFSETLPLPPTAPVLSPFSNSNIIKDTNTTTFHAGGSNNAAFFHSFSAFPALPAPIRTPQTSVKNPFSGLPAETEEGRKFRQGLEKKIADYQVENKIKAEHPDT